MKKNLAILGSTGSIGTQALDIISKYPDKFVVEVLVAGNNIDLVIQVSLGNFPGRLRQILNGHRYPLGEEEAKPGRGKNDQKHDQE
ncbi:MAG: hypothetical protein HGA23_04845 [Bacteroidales bacterium]|nr:hypothetical protein [Bacteroidales bacterium]